MIFKRVKELERRVKQLECKHENVKYTTYFMDYKWWYKTCKDCGKHLGCIKESDILKEDLERHQKAISNIKQKLKEAKG